MKKFWHYWISLLVFIARVINWAYPAIMMAIAIVILYICVSGIIQANEVFKQERIKKQQQLNTTPCK